MTVKVKTKNKIVQDQRLTLDAIHLKQIKKFQTLQKSIPLKMKEISKIEDQIKKIEKDADSKKNDLFEYFELMDQRRVLDLKIKNLEKEIEEIKSNREEEDYLLNVSHIMTQYYINRDNHQSDGASTNPNVQIAKKPNKKMKDVFDLFENYKPNNNDGCDLDNSDSNNNLDNQIKQGIKQIKI